MAKKRIKKIEVLPKREGIRIEPVIKKRIKLVGKKTKPKLINPLVTNVKN